MAISASHVHGTPRSFAFTLSPPSPSLSYWHDCDKLHASHLTFSLLREIGRRTPEFVPADTNKKTSVRCKNVSFINCRCAAPVVIPRALVVRLTTSCSTELRVASSTLGRGRQRARGDKHSSHAPPSTKKPWAPCVEIAFRVQAPSGEQNYPQCYTIPLLIALVSLWGSLPTNE